MIKFFTLAVILTIVSFFLVKSSAFGQTATPTMSATPTTAPTSAVPTKAPATGFGPN